MLMTISDTDDPDLKFHIAGHFVKYLYKTSKDAPWNQFQDMIYKNEVIDSFIEAMHSATQDTSLQQMMFDDFKQLVLLALIDCKGQIADQDDPKTMGLSAGHHEFSR